MPTQEAHRRLLMRFALQASAYELIRSHRSAWECIGKHQAFRTVNHVSTFVSSANPFFLCYSTQSVTICVPTRSVGTSAIKLYVTSVTNK